jgi:hypothetical protein
MYRGICHGRVVREEDGGGVGVTSIRAAGDKLPFVDCRKEVAPVTSTANNESPGLEFWFTQIDTSESVGRHWQSVAEFINWGGCVYTTYCTYRGASRKGDVKIEAVHPVQNRHLLNHQ